MTEPRVSALIPVHDGEEHLDQAIESALAQTHPPMEVIVVANDCSDRSAEIAESFGGIVRVVSEPRRGITFARNTALAAAQGDYLAFLDHDDLWEPAKTENQLAAFDADPGLALVLGLALQFADEDLDPAVAARITVPNHPQPGMLIGAVLAPRSTFEKVGDWQGANEVADGLVWFIRARELGLRERMLDEVVVRRRIHGGNQSFHNHDQRSEWLQALKGSLDAKRAGVRPETGDDRSGV